MQFIRLVKDAEFRDWLLIPYWFLRYYFALCWMFAWFIWRRITDPTGEPAWQAMWGRHESPEPVMCECCLWAGPRRWVIHGYQSDGDGDVEPVDECPRCGQEI